MRSLLAVFFGLLVVFSFANVSEGTASNVDVQEVNGETLAYNTDAEVESDEVASVAEEIENELEEAIADMIAENEEEASAVAGVPSPSLPLMFPSLTKTGKSNRKMNQDMAVKVASIIEEAVMLVANDILQTTVLLQMDPAEFLQSNTTSSSE